MTSRRATLATEKFCQDLGGRRVTPIALLAPATATATAAAESTTAPPSPN